MILTTWALDRPQENKDISASWSLTETVCPSTESYWIGLQDELNFNLLTGCTFPQFEVEEKRNVSFLTEEVNNYSSKLFIVIDNKKTFG